MRTLLVVGVVAVLSVHDSAAQRTRAVRTRSGPPGCSEVRGLPNMYLSLDSGRTFSRSAETTRSGLTWGIVTIEDTPTIVVAAVNDQVYDSSDGGCNWSLRYTITKSIHHPLKAIGSTSGRAYIWNDEVELRYDHGVVTPMAHAEPFGGLGVDRSNRDHLRGFAVVGGTMWESRDGGDSWQRSGISPGSPVIAAAFDPSNFDHIIVSLSNGFTVTHNGGATWKRNATFTRSFCDGAFVASSPNVVWLNFISRTDSDTVYRSTDGGETFEAVGKIEGLENNVCTQLAVDPLNSSHASMAFRSIYTFDAVMRSVTAWMCCGTFVSHIAYSPADRNVVFVYASQ